MRSSRYVVLGQARTFSCDRSREQLHLGVVRDVERQERQRIKNLYFLEQQRELTKKLQAAQNESDELSLRGL